MFCAAQVRGELNRALQEPTDDWDDLVAPRDLALVSGFQQALELVVGEHGLTREQLVPLFDGAKPLAREEQRVFRGMQLEWDGHGGSRWRRLLLITSSINNERWDATDLRSGALKLDEGFDPDLFLFEDVPEKDVQDAPRQLQRIVDHVRAVTALEVRLGIRAGAAWVLRRYATRCRHLRLPELTALLNTPRAVRKREHLLTQDAALFLFDQGFHAVPLEVRAGPNRYDMLAEPNLVDDPLLVEAKLFDSRRPALSALVEGVKQILSYISGCRSEVVRLPQPVLLIFRLGGPRPLAPRASRSRRNHDRGCHRRSGASYREWSSGSSVSADHR
jgi:hypothetical protein